MIGITLTIMNTKIINESATATKSSESKSTSINIKMNGYNCNDRKHPPDDDQLLQQQKKQQQQQQQKQSLAFPDGNFHFHQQHQQQQQQQKESHVDSPDGNFLPFDQQLQQQQQQQQQQQLIKTEVDDDDTDDTDDENSDDEYSVTDSLGPYDIICGRGSVAFNNCGNRRFRVLIGLNVDEYIAIDGRHRKGLFIGSLVHTIIHGIGAKFYKLSKNDKELTELTETQIRAKVGHALRDMAAFQVLQEKQQPKEQQQQQQQQQQQSGSGDEGKDANTNTTTNDDNKPSPVSSKPPAKRRRRRRSSFTAQKKLKPTPIARSSFSAPSLSLATRSSATRSSASEFIRNTMNANANEDFSSALSNHLRNFAARSSSSSSSSTVHQQQQQQRASFVGLSSLIQQQNFRTSFPPLHINASAVQHQPIAPTAPAPVSLASFRSNISNTNNNDNEMMKINHPMTYRPGMFETHMGAFDFQSQQQGQQQQQQQQQGSASSGGGGGGGDFRRSSSISNSSSKDTKRTSSITRNYDPLMMEGRFFPVSANSDIGVATDKVHQQLQLQSQEKRGSSLSSGSGSAAFAQEAMNVLVLDDRMLDINNNDPVNDDPLDDIDFIPLDESTKQQQPQGQSETKVKSNVDENDSFSGLE